MIIIYLNNELIHFSQKSPYLSMSACPYLSISRYKNANRTFHISVELLLMFLIEKKFQLNILTAIFSGTTEQRQKLKMLEI